MIETATIISLIVLIGFQEYHNRKERAKLINAILSKSVNEYKELQLADNTSIKIKPEKQNPIEPMEHLSDDDWFKQEIKPKL